MAEEVLWGHRFSPMMSLAEGFFDIDYGAFHHTFEVFRSGCLGISFPKRWTGVPPFLRHSC